MKTTGFISAWRFPVRNRLDPNFCLEVCISAATEEDEYEVWASEPVAGCIRKGLSKEEAFETALFASETLIPDILASVEKERGRTISFSEVTWAMVARRLSAIYGVPFTSHQQAGASC